jgi:hypothetical protein
MTVHPSYSAVATMCSFCPTFEVPSENCSRQGCPFTWQRHGVEGRKRDEERDRRAREERDRANQE